MEHWNEEACSLHKKDEIYVNVQEDNRIAFVTWKLSCILWEISCSFMFGFYFILMFFQHLDDDSDSDSEEMQVSSIDSLQETSEILRLIVTFKMSDLILKLARFGDRFGCIIYRALKGR